MDTAAEALFLSNLHFQERQIDFAERMGVVSRPSLRLSASHEDCPPPKNVSSKSRCGSCKGPVGRRDERKVALRAWVVSHLGSGPARWDLFTISDYCRVIPEDIRISLSSMKSVVALELTRHGFISHESSNTKRGMSPRLWSPKSHWRLSALSAAERTVRYEKRCAARAQR
jgi:hypothetical protein